MKNNKQRKIDFHGSSGYYPCTGMKMSGRHNFTIGGHKMGKGDKRTKKGKICIGSYGKSRPTRKAKRK